jgi:hypothetical protein
MAKQSVWDYSTSPASNTDVDGVDATGATGLVKSGDNYTRSMMSHMKGFALDLGSANTVGGTADVITVTLASAPSALVDGMRFTFNASAANTGATTLNVTPAGGSAFGAKKLMKWEAGSEAELSANEIPAANALIEVIYDSARDSANGAFMKIGSSVAAATTSAAGIVELATAAEALTGTDATRAVTPAGLYFPTGHLYGLTLSNNGTDATNDIDIAAGTARDSTDTVNMILASALTKRLDAAWAVGSGNGGLDTGSIADTTYYIWLIKRSDTGVVDALFSTSASSPTMPANYDYKRRIGSILRSGGAILPFRQSGDRFYLVSPVRNTSALSVGTSRSLVTTTAPPNTLGLFQVTLYRVAGVAVALVQSTFETDVAPGSTPGSSIASPVANEQVSGEFQKQVDSSSQIALRSNFASSLMDVYTTGWVDTRGRV